MKKIIDDIIFDESSNPTEEILEICLEEYLYTILAEQLNHPLPSDDEFSGIYFGDELYYMNARIYTQPYRDKTDQRVKNKLIKILKNNI